MSRHILLPFYLFKTISKNIHESLNLPAVQGGKSLRIMFFCLIKITLSLIFERISNSGPILMIVFFHFLISLPDG